MSDPIADPPTHPAALPTSAAGPGEIARLYAALDDVSPQANPRTARLIEAGTKRMARGLIEAAGDVALEASHRGARATVRASADLLYHLVVLWRECGITPDEVWGEMHHRAARFGLAEKPPRGVDALPPSTPTGGPR